MPYTTVLLHVLCYMSGEQHCWQVLHLMLTRLKRLNPSGLKSCLNSCILSICECGTRLHIRIPGSHMRIQYLIYVCGATGSAAVAAPQIDLSALGAAANAAANTTLMPTFDYGANDITGLLSAFVFEDVGVTAYNGAAPLITDKTLLASAVSIGLVEGYHAGIVSSLSCDTALRTHHAAYLHYARTLAFGSLCCSPSQILHHAAYIPYAGKFK